MLTLFTIPKPFKGHIDIIQRNAIRSWLKLPGCETILFGDDEGVGKAAEVLGAKHIPEIKKNEYGTPLLDLVFEVAQEVATHQLVCYVNTDIILFGDLLSAVKQIQFEKYLMAGQRWDIDIDKLLNFEEDNWEEKLRSYVTTNGLIHRPSGSDYFIFPRGTLGEFPPFAVGRPGWDTWAIYRARALGIPAINATQVVTAVHQNHDYNHVAERTGKVWWGPEADRNIDLLGGWDYVFTLCDTNWILTPQGLCRPKWAWELLIRFMLTLPVLHPRLRPVASMVRACWRAIKESYKVTRSFYRSIRFKLIDIRIKMQIKQSPLKIVVGASGVFQSGWVATDIEHLNILFSESWEKYFNESSIDVILAEHVWEHLTVKEATLAAKNCFKYLKKNGYLRVAVPDGFHPSPEYVKAIRPGGSGAGANDHKVLYNYKTLSKVFKSVGFDIALIEWFDEDGHFHSKKWDKDSGLIRRSSKYDERNKNGQLNYTSIILDAWKR